MSSLLCGVGGGQQGLARLRDDIVRDPADGDELAACASQGGRELGCPDVLPEEHRRRRARLEVLGSVDQVLLAEQPGCFEAERIEAAPDVLVDVAELECCDSPILVLADERQVDDPDRVRLDEFASAGAISPVNRLPGNDTIMYSTGPISSITSSVSERQCLGTEPYFISFISCGTRTA